MQGKLQRSQQPVDPVDIFIHTTTSAMKMEAIYYSETLLSTHKA